MGWTLLTLLKSHLNDDFATIVIDSRLLSNGSEKLPGPNHKNITFANFCIYLFIQIFIFQNYNRLKFMVNG